MPLFYGEHVTLLINEGEVVKVGTAEVWPIRIRYVFEPDRQVGKLVLQGHRIYVRDLTSCGDPLPVPFGVAVCGLEGVLAYASGLFGEAA